MKNIFSAIGQDKYFAATIVGATFYSIFFSYYLIMKHYTFRTLMFDLGLYDHWFWMTLKHGPVATGMFHNSLTLYTLLPFYTLLPSPTTLIVIQSMVVASASIPLYLLARSQLNDKRIAFFVAVIFLLYPPLHGLSQFDFHVEMFLPLLMFTALYYLHTKRWRPYLLATIILLATMEYAAYITLMMGIYQIIFYRRHLKESFRINTSLRLKFTISKEMLAAFAVITLSLAYMMCANMLSKANLPVANPIIGQEFFNIKGLEVMWEMKIYYLLKLLGPLAFLPIVSPTPLIMAVPWLVHTAFTTEPEMLKTFNQYSAYTVSSTFTSLLFAFKKIDYKKSVKVLTIVLVVVATLYFIIATDAITANPWPQAGERERFLNEIIQQIPSDAGVLTQNNIAPHLTEREKIFIWPVGAPTFGPKNENEVDYILVDKSQYHYYYAPVPAGYPYDATKVAVEQLLSTGKYKLLVEEDGIEFYTRVS